MCGRAPQVYLGLNFEHSNKSKTYLYQFRHLKLKLPLSFYRKKRHQPCAIRRY